MYETGAERFRCACTVFLVLLYILPSWHTWLTQTEAAYPITSYKGIYKHVLLCLITKGKHWAKIERL